GITTSGATLNGTANPNGASTTGQFQYGTTASYDSTTPVQSLGSGIAAVAIGGGTISGLQCGTLYHFRATAMNAGGTMNGSDATFTTGACPPAVTTGVAGKPHPTAIRVNATVNPSGAPVTVTFQYGPTTGYGGSKSVDVAAGNSDVPVAAQLSGLTCN